MPYKIQPELKTIQELIEAPPSPPPRPIIDIDLPEEQNFLTAPEDDDDADGRRSNNRVGGERASECWRWMGRLNFPTCAQPLRIMSKSGLWRSDRERER